MGDAPIPGIAESSPWWLTLAGIGIACILAPVVMYVVRQLLPEHGAHREEKRMSTPPTPPTDTALDRALEQLIGQQSKRLEVLEAQSRADSAEVANLRRRLDAAHAELNNERAVTDTLRRKVAELQRRIDELTNRTVAE